MENLKIRVTSEDESQIVQGLLENIGFETGIVTLSDYIFAKSENGEKHAYNYVFNADSFKEINLQQLRDMVVLNRNDRKDTNVLQEGDIPCLYDLYLTDNKELYFYHCGKEKWILSNLNGDQDYYKILKPIKKDEVMKEYLEKQADGSYTLSNDGEIEIPYWANYAAFANGQIHFSAVDSFVSSYVVWQRHTQPEELPFIDDESTDLGVLPEFHEPSLNDQYAEIEQVRKQTIEATLAERQAQYGSFVSVANTTGQLMGVIKNSKNGSTLPYAHEEALHMICSKIARIVNGDYNSIDGWHDIAGYATLVEKLIDG